MLMYWAVLFLALQLSCSAEQKDFRHISYEDLKLTSSEFTDLGVTSYAQLVFDEPRKQLLVGARDALYRLDLEDLSLKERATWSSSQEKVSLCQTKGQSEENCRNYIKVLQAYDWSVFACGTNAYSPLCSWREIGNLSNVLEVVDGKAKCPYNPKANVTALISSNGSYYVGGPTDFSGSDSAIYRSMGQTGHTLRTSQYNSKWLNDPQFVGSFETDDFVYFLFREAAVEFINCGKVIYSRIARVCKSDQGGQIMLKDNWTTFIKARLNCSIPGEYPFYYNEIQGSYYLPSEGIVYATFTTPENGVTGSAICAFNMTAINAAFSGPFKYQENSGSTWEPVTANDSHRFDCRPVTREAQYHYASSSKFQLMDNAVQPTDLQPLVTANLERYTQIVVETLTLRTKASTHVLYVATVEGLVKKYALVPTTGKTCLVEVWHAARPDIEGSIRTMRYYQATKSVYIGTDTSVMRVPVERCKRHVSLDTCRAARDPHCGWHTLRQFCSVYPDNLYIKGVWVEDFTSCPLVDAPVDGSWSAWSTWSECLRGSDPCLCRSRQCDNPAPKRGGRECTGHRVEVANCTVNGGWTEWSAWSECSQTCGPAVKTRRRSCGNPAPSHGGRLCVGEDTAQVYCTNNPPCPSEPTQAPNNSWSPWSSWSSCTAPCGGGNKQRTRKCERPSGCTGPTIEYEPCNSRSCPERSKTKFTTWANITGENHRGEFGQKRYRFTCTASAGDFTSLNLLLVPEERVCHKGRNCTVRDNTTRWTEWTPCSAKCGGGTQQRSKICDGRSECTGQLVDWRRCNERPCKGEWSSWTEWSHCSVSCGIGTRYRNRTCSPSGHICEGNSYLEETCEMAPCSSLLGWGEWTPWSDCDSHDLQHRTRKCRVSVPEPGLCQGPKQETRLCPTTNGRIEVVQASAGSLAVWAYCLAGFAAGMAVAYMAHFVRERRRRRSTPSNSPPCIHAEQNPYSTVPMHSLSPKRQANLPSPSHCSASNKFFNNINYSKVNDHDRATMKRNSHSLNNSMLMKKDDSLEKYY